MSFTSDQLCVAECGSVIYLFSPLLPDDRWDVLTRRRWWCVFVQDNIFEWHFTIAGPQDTPFEGGRFHGRLILPTDYPMKPPNIIIMTVSVQPDSATTTTAEAQLAVISAGQVSGPANGGYGGTDPPCWLGGLARGDLSAGRRKRVIRWTAPPSS